MTYDETTAGLLERNARNAPDSTFVAFPGGSWTHLDTLHRARSVANGLRGLGVAPGDYVVSWLPNGAEALLALLGVNVAGAVEVPLNTAYRGGLLEHALNLSAAPTLIVHYELVEHLATIDVPHVRTLVVVGGDSSSISNDRFDIVPWSALEDGDISELPAECRRHATNDMVVIFTSGTTGPSKGVQCSYLHHASYAEWFSVGDLGADDRVLIVLPLFHVGGTGWVYAALTWGASVAILPRFETRRFWQDVAELGATTCTMVGAMATFLLQQPPRDDDAQTPLRIALATPWMETWPEFAERFGVDLWAGFGMSEVPGPLRSEFPDADLTGLGRETSPEWEIRVADELDQEVPDGAPGEMIVRHRRPWTITHGYLNMPVESGAAWRNGWFHTGDVVIRREDGSYIYVDRQKDSIRRRGENISSLEVEVELRAHPDVLDVAVVAVPSEHSDDEVMAFVEVKEGAQVDCEELITFVLPRMPHYMVPRYIQVVDELPRTPTGKLRKVELRQQGVGPATWDREASRVTVKSARLSAVARPDFDVAVERGPV